LLQVAVALDKYLYFKQYQENTRQCYERENQHVKKVMKAQTKKIVLIISEWIRHGIRKTF
jgi:hypothetical protein